MRGCEKDDAEQNDGEDSGHRGTQQLAEKKVLLGQPVTKAARRDNDLFEQTWMHLCAAS